MNRARNEDYFSANSGRETEIIQETPPSDGMKDPFGVDRDAICVLDAAFLRVCRQYLIVYNTVNEHIS